jgi:predicted TIM-barrel fold metal-dependent hydrolase
LEIGEPTREEAKADFLLVKEQARREGTLRIASKPLLDWLINAAIEQAHRKEFPIQIHTGFGNPNLDIAKANPALLRRVIHGDQYRGAKIVLLHASYPYARTLGYLTAIYPNVYADLGLAIPFAVGETYAVLRELLALAPANKVLYSSDAFFIPELFWLGAKLGRRTLGVVLGEYIAEGLIDERAARDIAEMILWRNAEQLYLQ